MRRFYTFSHNTAYTHGMPEIYEIVLGMVGEGKCLTCGAFKRYPAGDLRVHLGKTRAKMWPDAIACGDYPCFIVSDRLVNAMEREDVRLILGGKVELVEPIQNSLALNEAPSYFWVDGKQHFAGRVDFEASGFVDVGFCCECGRRFDNVGLTYERRHAQPPPPYVFSYDESSGLDVFTTDIAPTAFFCTERVLECARKNKLTNLRFCPIEEGALGRAVTY